MTGRHLRFFSRQPYFIGIFLVQPVIWLLLFGARKRFFAALTPPTTRPPSGVPPAQNDGL